MKLRLAAVYCSLALAVFALLGGCGGGAGNSDASKKRFIFITNGDDPFWDTCKAGWDEMAKEMKLADAAVDNITGPLSTCPTRPLPNSGSARGRYSC